MHVTYPITLVDHLGNVQLLDQNDAARLAREIRYGYIILKGTSLEDRFRLRLHGPNIDGSNVYTARDFYGVLITNLTWPVKPNGWRRYVDPQKIRAAELGLPIPHTACWKKGRSASNKAQFREVRQQVGHDEQIRATGANDNGLSRKRDEPGWDRCNRHYERNWKSQRKTQWKA